MDKRLLIFYDVSKTSHDKLYIGCHYFILLEMDCTDSLSPLPHARIRRRKISWQLIYHCTYGWYPGQVHRKNCISQYPHRDYTDDQVCLPLRHNWYKYKT